MANSREEFGGILGVAIKKTRHDNKTTGAFMQAQAWPTNGLFLALSLPARSLFCCDYFVFKLAPGRVIPSTPSCRETPFGECKARLATS